MVNMVEADQRTAAAEQGADVRSLIDYARTADIRNDPLVVDLANYLADRQVRIDKALAWVDANKEHLPRPMAWELTSVLIGE